MILLLWLALASVAHAFDADFNFLLENELRDVVDNPLNPGNRIARTPTRLSQADLRAELKQNTPWVDLVARPRLEGRLTEINGQGSSSADAFFQEAFLRAHVADPLTISVGRIQYGWGPAESITPTNWLAPEIQYQASPYYEQLGYYRAQANLTVDQNFSFVAAVELHALKDQWSSLSLPPEAFHQRFFGKGEWSWQNGNRILGFVGGGESLAAGKLGRGGSYGSWTLSDAFQFYYDAAMREQAPAGDWRALAVAGVRYTLANGAEVHLEGIKNGEGYSNSAKAAAEASLAGLSVVSLSQILLDRNETLLGRGYVYASFSWANAGFFPSWAQTPLFHVRALNSLTDHSTSLLADLEVGFLDHYTVALYAAFGFGAPDTEMRELYHKLGGLTGKFSF